jgi:hypothetical protein
MTTQNNKKGSSYIKDSYLLSGKIIDSDGNKFTNQKSSKHAVKKYRYYKQKRLYLPAGDIEKITSSVINDLLDSDLGSILNKQKSLDFKSMNWDNLNQHDKADLIKDMIDKIVYTENKFTYFIKADDTTYLNSFKQENYHNATNKDAGEHIYLNSDSSQIVIEKDIYINNRTSTNRYEANGKQILTKSENASHLIKAISYAWRYRKMQEQGLSIEKIRDDEHKGIRSIYQYISLSYLSPNIVSSILDSNVPEETNLRMLINISREVDFEKQEDLFYT